MGETETERDGERERKKEREKAIFVGVRYVWNHLDFDLG
jgi:hypothetical protein